MRSITTFLSISLLSLGGLAACGPSEPEPTPAVEPGAIDPALMSELEAVSELEASRGALSGEEAWITQLTRQYQEISGGQDLSEAQHAVLMELLRSEEDVSARGLLSQIVEARERADMLQVRISELEARLPLPQIVQAGDTHFALASRWLTEVGIPEDEHEALVSDNLLADRLLPGMQVWHFLGEGGVYATSVTSGSSGVSPWQLQRDHVAGLMRARDEAQAGIEALEFEVAALETTRDALKDEQEHLARSLEDVSEERDAYAKASASFRVRMASMRTLREIDVLPDIGLRLKRWEKNLPSASIDTRSEDAIELDAARLQVDKLRKIVVLPQGRWEEGEDYVVEVADDAKTATLRLRRPWAFRNSEALVAVR